MRTSIRRALAAAALLCAGAAGAQELATFKPKETFNAANYAVSIPVGSFANDYIDRTSWRGIGFDTRSRFWDRISLGVAIDYARFEQTHSLLSVPAGQGGTLSGPVFRFADQFSLRALAHYYFPLGALTPYAGVGIGGVWSYAVQQTTDFMKTENSFDLVVAPEAGVLWAIARGATSAGLNAAVRYNWSQAAFMNVTNASTVQVVLGLFAAY
jgi:opacity protein-like surface antigen